MGRRCAEPEANVPASLHLLGKENNKEMSQICTIIYLSSCIGPTSTERNGTFYMAFFFYIKAILVTG